jgi:hypothetical protein
LIFYEKKFLGLESLLSPREYSSKNQEDDSAVITESPSVSNIYSQAKYKDELTKYKKGLPRSFHLGLENFDGAPDKKKMSVPSLSVEENQLISKENNSMKEVFLKIRSAIKETPNQDHICGKNHQKS